MPNKKRIIIQAMDDNEKIFCDYCDAECTASSLKYGNQLLEDNFCVWFQWDYICLDCSEKLSDRIESDPDLEQSMVTSYLIELSLQNKKGK